MPDIVRETYMPPQEVLDCAIKADAEEFERLHVQLAREKQWYTGHERFQTVEDIERAVAIGKLVMVGIGQSHRPIGRYLNPELHKIYPPYLAPHAYKALQELSGLFQKEVRRQGVKEPVMMSLTSLVRSVEYQRVIVENGQLASTDSTHTTGSAFDIHAKGYYMYRDDVLYSVNDLPVATSRRIASALRDRYSLNKTQDMPITAPQEWNDDRVHAAIDTVTLAMHQWGLINRVVEFEGTPNQCYHIAVNPEYEKYHA